MNNSQIATAVAIRDLNCYSLETIDDRILLQKKIYLAQDIGLPLGYGYSWYIHGPYSPDLTAAAYQIIPEEITAIENHSFREPYASMISRVNELENELAHQSFKISVVKWYELIASIAYWHKFGFNTEEKAIQKIRETNPQFTEEQIKAGYSTIRRCLYQCMTREEHEILHSRKEETDHVEQTEAAVQGGAHGIPTETARAGYERA